MEKLNAPTDPRLPQAQHGCASTEHTGWLYPPAADCLASAAHLRQQTAFCAVLTEPEPAAPDQAPLAEISHIFRLVNITNTALIFQLARDSGNREIAFTDNMITSCIEANAEGFCMNRKGMLRNSVDTSLTDSEKTYGSNKGGYNYTHSGRELMGQLDACFPDEVSEGLGIVEGIL